MISKAEQQMVAKLDDLKQLDTLFLAHVKPHKKFAAITLPDDTLWSDSESAIVMFLAALNENLHIQRNKDDQWQLSLGAAKKVITMLDKRLSVASCKALIIYVRKFL